MEICEPPSPCEAFWNQARICYEMCGKTGDKKERQSHLQEGQKHALQALEMDGCDFESLRWAAITTGQLTDYLGTKEKIEQGAKFKEYLDRALAINGREYSLLHMRGRYTYSVAAFSWRERKAAAAFYSTPPTATYDEALSDFLAAYAVKPDWIENLIYIGRCYLKQKRKKNNAQKYFNEALALEARDEYERELLIEACITTMPEEKTTETKIPSLECADPECSVICDSMVALVHHVAAVHKADVEVNDFQFPNLEEFEAWRTEMEQTTCSKFCKVSGRLLPNEISKYFLCHLSGYPNRKKNNYSTRPERKRKRPTKKLGCHCTAFMSFKQNKADGTINVRGCLRHFGHPIDVRRLPLPELVRKEVSDLLLKGSAEEEIVQQIQSQYPENERGHWIQRYEVRNIAVKLRRQGLLSAPERFIYSEEEYHIWEATDFRQEVYLPVYDHLEDGGDYYVEDPMNGYYLEEADGYTMDENDGVIM